MKGLRFAVLFFNCVLITGVAFNNDLASVVISPLQRRGCSWADVETKTRQLEESGHTNVTCCVECLGLSPLQFNTMCGAPQFFGVFAAIFTGIAIDRCGYCQTALFLSVLAVVSTSLCIVATIRSCLLFMTTTKAFGLLLFGRILFVTANCGLVVVRNFICALWFAKYELTSALGTSIAVNSLGNAMNFLVTANFEQRYGLTGAYILGTAVCFTSVLGALGVSFVDWLSQAAKVKKRPKEKVKPKAAGALEADVEDIVSQFVAVKVRLSSVRSYSVTYWGALIHFVLSTACVWPFVSNACKYVSDFYHMGAASSIVVGSLHFTCLVALPLTGFVSDKLRAYGSMGILASALFVVTYACLMVHVKVNPIIWFIFLGIAYSLSQTNTLTIIFNVSSSNDRATAAALATATSLLVNGLVSVALGLTLNSSVGNSVEPWENPWSKVLPGFETLALLGLVVIVALNIKDATIDGGQINPCCRKHNEEKLLTDTDTDYGAVEENVDKEK